MAHITCSDACDSDDASDVISDVLTKLCLPCETDDVNAKAGSAENEATPLVCDTGIEQVEVKACDESAEGSPEIAPTYNVDDTGIEKVQSCNQIAEGSPEFEATHAGIEQYQVCDQSAEANGGDKHMQQQIGTAAEVEQPIVVNEAMPPVRAAEPEAALTGSGNTFFRSEAANIKTSLLDDGAAGNDFVDTSWKEAENDSNAVTNSPQAASPPETTANEIDDEDHIQMTRWRSEVLQVDLAPSVNNAEMQTNSKGDVNSAASAKSTQKGKSKGSPHTTAPSSDMQVDHAAPVYKEQMQTGNSCAHGKAGDTFGGDDNVEIQAIETEGLSDIAVGDGFVHRSDSPPVDDDLCRYDYSEVEEIPGIGKCDERPAVDKCTVSKGEPRIGLPKATRGRGHVKVAVTSNSNDKVKGKKSNVQSRKQPERKSKGCTQNSVSYMQATEGRERPSRKTMLDAGVHRAGAGEGSSKSRKPETDGNERASRKKVTRAGVDGVGAAEGSAKSRKSATDGRERDNRKTVHRVCAGEGTSKNLKFQSPTRIFKKLPPSDFPTVRCNVRKFHKLVKSLKPTQRRWVESMGFGSLLSLSFTRLDQHLCYWIMKRFNHRTRRLSIRKDYQVDVDANDVGWVLGIPSGPYRVSVATVDEDKVEILKKKYNNNCGISEDFLAQKIKAGCNEKQFQSDFLLYVLGVVLCPTQNNKISPHHVRALCLEDSCFETFNWCQYVFDWLLKCAEKFKKAIDNKGYGGGLGGCAVFLMV